VPPLVVIGCGCFPDGLVMTRKSVRYRFGDVDLDVQNLRVTVDGQIRPLEPKSCRLLVFLVENRGRTVAKDEIIASVWSDAHVTDNALTRAIGQIRKAIDDVAKESKYLETVPTVGYRFIGDCEEEQNPAVSPEAEVSNEGSAHGIDRSRSKVPLAIGAILIAAVGIAIWWMMAGGRSAIPFPLHVTRVSKLTSYPGDERDPSISPDGSYVAFSWSGPEGDNYDIYVVQSGGQQPLRLTRDPAPDSFPAWSPDGSQIAFVRRKGPVSDIILVPPLGGPERTLHEFSAIGVNLDFSQHPLLSWSSDGKWIVYSGQFRAGEKFRLFALSIEDGTVRAISSPDAELAGDSSPALAANGKFLAFVRYLGPINGSILIQPLGSALTPSGEITDVTKSGLGLHSPVWLEDGTQLLFADATQIFQWERGKEAVSIYAADGALGGLSLGPKRRDHTRRVVVASEKRDPDIWEIPLMAGGTKASGAPRVIQRSTANDYLPDFSPDGRRIAFSSDRSGSSEIWLCDADGGNPRQLTHLGAYVAGYPKWSPDGTRIVFHARVPDIAEVYIVDADHGVPRQITHEDPGLAVATWSKDGRFVYASTLVGRAVTYRIPANGGPKERLWDGELAEESADGRYILYSKTNLQGIFRRSLEGDLTKNQEELIVPDFWRANHLGSYAPVSGGIYYVSANEQGRPGPFRYFDYGSRKSIDVAPAVPGLDHGLTISPDHRRLVFSASAEIGGDLLSLELR
jgi:Tol biopolymer transport system component/DNA-binding winged helix-turn-helix (wHTH) protein